MDIFDFLTLLGGLCLFLFGMNIMGQALERRAGGKLRNILGKMTSNKGAGFLTGCGVTAIIQSSSATTVMVVGFVNSGLMTLHQSISVIMGANVGTTVTSWILSLGGIDGNSVFVKMLKPTSFTPILALAGLVLYMFFKQSQKKDTGMILLGFATLMSGMETMTSAVSGLAGVPAFRNLFVAFENPILGLLVGAILTAVLQSSSASVGILQALAATGQISFSAAIPIIMGQNIGTCVTALLSSIGANKNAKRAAFVHLSFNVVGATLLLSVFSVIKAVFAPAILQDSASSFGIAVAHTAFNLLCVAILMPFSALLEKLALKVIREPENPEKTTKLDERLLATPPLALAQCREVTVNMAEKSVRALKNSLYSVTNYSKELAQSIRQDETDTDHDEDVLGTYLIRLSSEKMNLPDSEEATELLKMIGDFERIADHAVNILESSEELREKKRTLSEEAVREFEVLAGAVSEILDITLHSFRERDLKTAMDVEPLEQVIDQLKEQLRTRHILRMPQGKCSVESGFVLSDLLTNLERTSDHCSNIAGCLIDTAHHNLNLHETLSAAKTSGSGFEEKYRAYAGRYTLD